MIEKPFLYIYCFVLNFLQLVSRLSIAVYVIMDLEGFLKTQKWICKVDDEGYKQLNAKMWQKILLVPYEWNMKCCFFVGDKYCEFKDKVTEFEFELSIVRKEKEGGLFIRFENGIYRINHLCMKAYNWYDGTKHKWEGVGLDVGCIEFEYVGLRFWYAAYKDIGADVDKLKCIKKVFAAMEEHLPSTYGEIVKDGRQHSKIGEESLLHAARLVLEIPEFKVFEKLYHELFQREKPAPFFCHVIEAVPPAIDLCFTHLIFKNMPLLVGGFLYLFYKLDDRKWNRIRIGKTTLHIWSATLAL